MATFFEEVKKLPGKNRTNVFALLIAKLSHFKINTLPDVRIIKSLLAEIKTLFHNHEQNFGVLIFILKQNLSQFRGISLSLRLFLVDVIATLDDESLNSYFDNGELEADDLQCRIQRMFESQLATQMLLNPPPAMWDSINKMSESIISLLEGHKELIATTHFLKDLGPGPEGEEIPNLALAFGRFDHTPSVDEVIAVLREQKNLIMTMLIQFLFLRDAYVFFKLGSMPAQLEKYGGDFAGYLEEEPCDPRMFFLDFARHAPHLYTDRGRGKFDFITSKSLGITVDSSDRAEFPSMGTSWCPDCLCQRVKLDSPYVKNLIKRDIPYVAGPSGMTSIFCGGMLFLTEWDTWKERYYYLLGVMSFITGGGLHSMHEVLSIPHVRLGLMPHYKVTGPQAGNYHDFFQLYGRDPVFNRNLSVAWRKTVSWLGRTYPHLMEIPERLATIESLAKDKRTEAAVTLTKGSDETHTIQCSVQ